MDPDPVPPELQVLLYCTAVNSFFPYFTLHIITLGVSGGSTIGLS